jgi:hypothetical protein
MRVIGKTRNHMPVQMRHQVAERSKIDLVGRHHLAQRGFGSEYHAHQRLLMRDR